MNATQAKQQYDDFCRQAEAQYGSLPCAPNHVAKEAEQLLKTYQRLARQEHSSSF